VIEPGPKPEQPVRIDSVHRDEALLSVHIIGLEPDPSWTALEPAWRAKLPPGSLAICAFAERLLCDALVQPGPPPFDGLPHDLTVDTNRLLLTSRGWVDCVHYVCAVVVSRAIDVAQGDGGVGSNTEITAIVPYQLPATTPEMERPTLTMDRAGPFAPDETVPVTLHDPPPNVDLERLQLGQCSAEDLRIVEDCTYRFGQWTRLPDGSLRQQWKIAGGCAAPGCYLAIPPPTKGVPEVARTERFSVSP